MKKIVTTMIIAMLALNTFAMSLIFVSNVSSKSELPDYEPINLDEKFRDTNYGISSDVPLVSSSSSSGGPRSAASVGDFILALALDNYYGYYFWTYYECRAVGDFAEVWVQENLDYPEGDPRDTPVITDEHVEYLLEEFDNTIYPIDTQYFGTPDFHDGSYSLLEAWGLVPPGGYFDLEGKSIIMVSNVRDESYYNPGYPYYIAGFYSPSFEAYIDRNIITIDSHDWLNRVGDDAARTNLYESIIAHEYQHLIHDDYNPDDDTFMNEGCSMYAEPLCGYPIDWGAINSYLATPDNSLTDWGDQGDINILADYGAAMAWTIYLSDQYGGAALISHFVQAGIPGVEGVNAALEYFGYTDTFNDAYHNWRIANLIHSGDGAYNYHSIDFNEADPIFLNDVKVSPHLFSGTDLGTTTTILGYDTGVSMIGPYGSDYLYYDNWRPSWSQIFFDGDETVTYGWRQTEDGWYTGEGDLMNTLLVANAYVDSADPTLYMNTYWDIEDEWDFAFVQVSTDDGATWTSLENEYTTYNYTTGAHPDIIANLPGITYYVGEVLDITYDLSAYAGQDVLLGFRYMTDWAFTYAGWYIFDAAVGGTSLELYKDVVYEASYMVTLVAMKGLEYEVIDLGLDEFNSYIETLIREDWDSIVLIVSTTQDFGLTDYKFGVTLGYHYEYHFNK